LILKLLAAKPPERHAWLYLTFGTHEDAARCAH
jgi:hypothetical protein